MRRKWNPNQVICEIQERAQKKKSLCSTVVIQEDSSLIKYAKKYFQSWKKALLASSIEYIHPLKTWTDKRFVTEIKNLPSVIYSEARKQNPNLVCSAKKRFGSWANAVMFVGIQNPVTKNRRWTKNVIIKAIQTRHTNRLSLCHTQVLKNDPSLLVTSKKYFTSWTQALLASGFTKPARHGNKWSAELVIQSIKKSAKNGEKINAISIQESNYSLFSAGVRYFGNWKKAVIASGEKYPKDKLVGENLLYQVIHLYFPNEKIILQYRKLPWLVGPKGWPLELDLYLPDKQLAFEFQGIHHYAPYHGQKALRYTQLRDSCKVKLCQNNGVKLIIVPYYQFSLNNIHIKLESAFSNTTKPKINNKLRNQIILYKRLLDALEKSKYSVNWKN